MKTRRDTVKCVRPMALRGASILRATLVAPTHEGLLAEVDDPQVCKLQIRERNAHRACERRRIHPLDLYAKSAAALEHQQVNQRHPDL